MNNAEDTLKEFASKSIYLGLPEGQDVKVTFCSFQPYWSPYYPDAESIRYRFMCQGGEKFLISASKDLALQMSKIPTGAEIRIRKSGEGIKTRYCVSLVPTELPKAEDLANSQGPDDIQIENVRVEDLE